MTEFYEIEVSRKATIRQSVKVRVPMGSVTGSYGAEEAAKWYVDAASKAGQPLVWVCGEPEPERYGTLETENTTAPEPVQPPPAPVDVFDVNDQTGKTHERYSV